MKYKRFKIKDVGFKKKNIFLLLIVFNLLSLIFNPIVNADQNVSATVLPRVSDFQFNLDSSSPQPLEQNEDITYQLTYGANQSAEFPSSATIVASWSGTNAPDNSQLLDYVDGSASTGYNGAVPVVDLINKTITWIIPDIPAGTNDQTVTFQLHTITDYSKPIPFTFNINATMSNQYVTMPVQTITQTYKYKTSPPGPQPTSVPTPTTPPTPTPTPAPLFGFNNVGFTALSDSGTTIESYTDKPSALTISYGTTPNNLTKIIPVDGYTYVHSFTLNGLSADTTYYYKITATDLSGQTISSDIFKFQTATQSVIANLENDIIILSSSGNVLDSDSQKENDLKNPAIILTNGSDYTISYALTNPIPLKSIDIVVINKVLGASTLAASDAPSQFVFPMVQKAPTLYTADLQTLPQGVYQVNVRLIDANGNIIEKQISDLKIMPKLTVYGADTLTPLSDARIYISYYDEQTNKYQPITSTLFGNIKNPTYTDAFGQSSITLPPGRYRVEESSLFYDPQTQDFTIGPGITQNFPILYLKWDPFNFVSLFNYTKDYFEDSWTKMTAILFETATSVRIFHLIDLAILVTFVCLTFFFFLFRSHLHVKQLPIFIRFHLNFLLKKHDNRYISGSIINAQNNPVTRVLIEIEDAETNNILTHGSSHKSGKFYFTNTYEKPINLLFIKEGYEPTTITLDNQTSIPKEGLLVKMKKGVAHHETVFSACIQGLEEGFGMLFEAFLVSSLVLEIFFFVFLSHQITLPFFFTLSLLNILLWLFYLHEHNNLRS